jgi:LAO/AO transport system kinase
VADLAHTRVVLCAPGAGDDVQAIKAGILEIADILVVNKADQPQAARAVEQLESMLALRPPGAPAVRVLATVATTGQGVAGLADLLEATPPAGGSAGRAAGCTTGARERQRQLLADTASRVLRERVLAGDEPALERLCERLERGEIGIGEAVRAVLGNG